MNKFYFRIKQVYIYIKYFVLIIPSFFLKKMNSWLISERGDEARDNGFSFYNYMINNHPEIEVKYVIKKTSPDVYKINKENIIYYGTFKHIWYFINSKYLISTHLMGYSPQMNLFSKLDKYHLIYVKGNKIFLQHGIILNKPGSFFKNIRIDLFCCSSVREYEFLKKELNLEDSAFKITGLSRYDKLISKAEKNKILFMPTWRSNLFYSSKEEFVNSDYYKNCMLLLNNSKLKEELQKKDISLYFYPHHEIQKFIDCFISNIKNVIIADDKKYDISQLICETDLLITDYSSVSFDFAYMKKPVLYYQFDRDEFFNNHYERGYFDYDRDGFGPVYSNVNEVVDYMCVMIKFDFMTEKKYINKSDRFFKYRDCDNSERIFQQIIKK